MLGTEERGQLSPDPSHAAPQTRASSNNVPGSMQVPARAKEVDVLPADDASHAISILVFL